MSDKPNGSRLKLYVTEDVGQPLGLINRLVTEQLTLNISRTVAAIGVTEKYGSGENTYLPGYRDVELSFDFIMDAAAEAVPQKINYKTLSDYEAAKRTLEWRVMLEGNTALSIFSFRAFISKFITSAPLEDKITCSLTLTRGV